MNRALWKKTFGEAQWLMLACSCVLFGYCWLRVWTVGLIDMSRFETIVEQFRDFERFSPVPLDQLVTFLGRISMAYDEPICVVTMTAWAISRGSDCISGELGRGTMEMLIAQPVSRLRVLMTKTAVTVGGVAVLATAAWFGTAAGVATTMVDKEPERASITLHLPLAGEVVIPLPWVDAEPRRVPISNFVSPRQFIPAAINLAAFGFFLSGVTTLLSSCDRYRWRTIGIAAGFTIVQLAMEVIGTAAEGARWLLRLSCFTSYDPVAFTVIADRSPEEGWALLLYDAGGHFSNLGPLGHNAVLLGLGLIAFALAAVIFCRRDLPAPL